MRKLLPHILGLASILWIIGGTVWYKNRYCDIVIPPSYAPVTVSQTAVYKEREPEFKALNLYYLKENFQFKITDELTLYFTDLKDYLMHNATAKIHIYAQNIADSDQTKDKDKVQIKKDKIGQKRLLFLQNTLKDKAFNLNQFEFHETAFQQKPINFQENDVKNQRLEIRLAVP